MKCPTAGLEAAALEVLRQAFQADVKALAEELRPRLLAGEFTGVDIGSAWEGGPVSENARFCKLEALCKKHPRVRTQEGQFLTIALASREAVNAELITCGGQFHRDDLHSIAGSILGLEVRVYAEREWGVSQKDLFRVRRRCPRAA